MTLLEAYINGITLQMLNENLIGKKGIGQQLLNGEQRAIDVTQHLLDRQNGQTRTHHDDNKLPQDADMPFTVYDKSSYKHGVQNMEKGELVWMFRTLDNLIEEKYPTFNNKFFDLCDRLYYSTFRTYHINYDNGTILWASFEIRNDVLSDHGQNIPVLRVITAMKTSIAKMKKFFLYPQRRVRKDSDMVEVVPNAKKFKQDIPFYLITKNGHTEAVLSEKFKPQVLRKQQQQQQQQQRPIQNFQEFIQLCANGNGDVWFVMDELKKKSAYFNIGRN